MKYTLFLLLIQFISLFVFAQKVDEKIADSWEYIGIAINDPGYHVWGSSPIYDETGKVHVFAARWADTIPFSPGWKTHSEIAHYVADSPTDTFRFSDLVLAPTGKRTWDKMGIHNPTIKKVRDKYALTYISNDELHQRIGLATAHSLYGPWEKAARDGMILQPPANPDYWNYNSHCGVTNPSLLVHPNGGFLLYYKTGQKGKIKMGLAFSEQLEGPYVQLPFPITNNDSAIEDGYAFHCKDKFYLLTTDNHGIIEKGGGLLWQSEDGIHFGNPIKAFHLLKNYLSQQKLPIEYKHHYGPTHGKFERPQVLVNDEGCPEYLFAPSGSNIQGGNSTISYILKLKTDE